MWEFEMLDMVTGSIDIFYGYSIEDAKQRYPDVDFSSKVCICRYYVD